MGRCRHEMLNIFEHGDCATLHARDSDGWSHEFMEGWYSGRITAHCLDCGLCRDYYLKTKRLPKWLREALCSLDLLHGGGDK
jgi:hypothetical protein